ncbi:MAG: sugar phosphate isomerase/epimerase family protein [Halobacteriota archaeon]|uniref:sugar phosphate isomerase/epimerase family protein n=1 Tax=Natronomonas sp. TaxID=2184060 RepID=UPI0039747EA7
MHSLRTDADPLPETIRRVAAAGYEGVEFAGRFLDADPHAVRSALDETGIVPVAAHVDLGRIERNPEAIVDRCRIAGCRRVVVPHVGSGHFRTTDRTDALVDRLTTLVDRFETDDIEFTYHNARHSFTPPLDRFVPSSITAVPLPLDGWHRAATAIGRLSGRHGSDLASRTGFGRLLERTPDALTFEIDVGWVVAAGYDPRSVFELVGDRLASVHISDVAVSSRFPKAYVSASPGEGIVDLAGAVAAARETDAEWLVFEDDTAFDPASTIQLGIEIVGGDTVSD